MPKCANPNCKHEASRGCSFCILHDDSPNKDPREFANMFEEMINDTDKVVLLENITFPNAFSFSYFKEKCKHLDFEFSTCTAPKLNISDFNYSNFNIRNSKIVNLTITNCKICELNIASCTIGEFEICESNIQSFSVNQYSPAEEAIECINSFYALGCIFGRIEYYNHITNKFHIACSTLFDARFNGIHNDMFVVRNNTFECQCVFTDISSKHIAIVNSTILKPQHFSIENSNLYGACFIGTNLTEIHFSGNEWKTDEHKRFMLFEELYLTNTADDPLPFWGGYNNDISYLKCYESYQQLKCNFEKRGNYSDAGDFHYGEMEARRLSNKGIWKYISIYSWYWYISSYGQSYIKAFCLFLGFLICSAVLQLYFGFKFEQNAIQYNIAFSLPFPSDVCQDFSKSFKLTIENAMLKQSGLTQLPTGYNTILYFFEICLGPLFLSQIILSVRRKLRR